MTKEFEERLKDAVRSVSPKVDIEGHHWSTIFAVPMTVERLNEELWRDPSSGGIRYALEGDAARSFARVMSGYRYVNAARCDVLLRITIWDEDRRLLEFYIGGESTGILWKGQCLDVQNGTTAKLMLEAALAAFRSAVPGEAKLQRECFELAY
ncbi:MAG: hypothetical protein MUF27_15285 [Acidobacteria bacterium]|nr:hypothetical protein [Acidobacteriota bacterium]